MSDEKDLNPWEANDPTRTMRSRPAPGGMTLKNKKLLVVALVLVALNMVFISMVRSTHPELGLTWTSPLVATLFLIFVFFPQANSASYALNTPPEEYQEVYEHVREFHAVVSCGVSLCMLTMLLMVQLGMVQDESPSFTWTYVAPFIVCTIIYSVKRRRAPQKRTE